MESATAAIFGGRNRRQAFRPNRKVASAGTSQFASHQEGRPLAVADGDEALHRGLVIIDVGGGRSFGIAKREAVEVREFGGHAAEVLPDAVKNEFDLSRRFFRECGGEIGAADAVLFPPRADPAHRPTRKVGGPLAVDAPDRMKKRDREPADNCGEHPLERPDTGFEVAIEIRSHPCARSQNTTMILPKTWRLSRRASPRSTSASGTSVSITGRSPEAILARLSRMLRIEAPNEAMIRYCCWKSCIRLSVVDGPDVAPQVTSRPPRLRQRSEPWKVSAPTCSKTTSTPFFAVILRTTPSNRSVR